MMRIGMLLLCMLLAGSAPAIATAQSLSPAIADPPPDPANPAGMNAFVLPVGGSNINCVLYTASGARSHPTLLLLHGFPGNEQNLDLGQAARRAGWNVLTLHYRGSWGSQGTFSFGRAAEDAHAALAFLRSPVAVAKYRIDPTRIVIAGHSMGGFMAADAAADDPKVIGLFLIDPWDIGKDGSSLGTEAGRKAWHEMAAADLSPLAGTSEQALADEMRSLAGRFSLLSRVRVYGDRPLAIYGASRGNGERNNPVFAAGRGASRQVVAKMWATDHSFSDKRVALAEALVAWLQTLPRG